MSPGTEGDLLNDDSRVNTRRGWAGAVPERTAAAVIATAALAFLAAACGGSGSSTGHGGSANAAGSTTSASYVAYSACMRSHGVPNYPDPDSSGDAHGQTPRR